MERDELYELVIDAVKQGLREEAGGDDVPLAKRMVGGRVIFEDSDGRRFKEMDSFAFFRKVTAVREKLRVLEQKINAHGKLTAEEKIGMQQYITGCYGSLTTFNVLFANKNDSFVGQKGDD